MRDLNDAANDRLTGNTPTAPNGEPDGLPAPEAPEPLAVAATVNMAGPAPAPGAVALQAALVGEPGGLPPTWCKVCQAEVKPEGKGRCPRCNTFLKLNFAARRHPVNKLRQQQFVNRLVAEYQPQTTLVLATCEHLAGILEQLEVLKPGGQEHQRLVRLSQLLGAALEESRSSREPRTPTNLHGMSAAQLADRAEAVAKTLRDMADREAEGAASIAHAYEAHQAADGGDVPSPVEIQRRLG